MRIAWNAMPVVFLSSACVPPVSSEFPTTPLGPSRALALSHSSTSADVIIEATSADVASWWQLPEGVTWQSFEKLTLVSALDGWKGKPLPDVRDLAVVKRAAAAGANAARLCSSTGTLWIVDMRGAGSVAFGQAMSRASAQPVALVLTFNNWPAESSHTMAPPPAIKAAFRTVRLSSLIFPPESC